VGVPKGGSSLKLMNVCGVRREVHWRLRGDDEVEVPRAEDAAISCDVNGLMTPLTRV
jgi:hypothetical protein